LPLRAKGRPHATTSAAASPIFGRALLALVGVNVMPLHEVHGAARTKHRTLPRIPTRSSAPGLQPTVRNEDRRVRSLHFLMHRLVGSFREFASKLLEHELRSVNGVFRKHGAVGSRFLHSAPLKKQAMNRFSGGSVVLRWVEQEDGVMTEPKLEVPTELRDLAEKTIDQAERAFGMFFDAANKSVASIPGPGTEISRQALSFTQQNMKAAFEHARKLVHATDLQQAMQIQSEFLRSQFTNAGEHMRQITGEVMSAAKEAAKPKSSL
jgi:phasin